MNSIAAANIAPLILDTQHSPPIPSSADAVTVKTRIVDEDFAAIGVTLNWRVDGQGDFNSLPMLDDGNNGDSLAGDRSYVATLPAQADLAVVEFYVHASDALGNSRTWPAPTADSGQVANALYQVLDSFDQSAIWVRTVTRPIMRS